LTPFSTASLRSSCGKPAANAIPQPHEANLFDIQAKIGEVVSETDIAAWLS